MSSSIRLARKVVTAAALPGRLARIISPKPFVVERVLGIDPGTLRLGYGLVERRGPGKLAYVECGVIAAPATQSRVARLGIIGRCLRELIEELNPTAVAIEEAFYGKNAQSTLALGEARGVAISVASQLSLPIAGYAPARVKNTVVGHGRASKEQMGFMVTALLGLRRVPEPDAADALAIAVCHARSFDFTAKLSGKAAGGGKASGKAQSSQP